MSARHLWCCWGPPTVVSVGGLGLHDWRCTNCTLARQHAMEAVNHETASRSNAVKATLQSGNAIGIYCVLWGVSSCVFKSVAWPLLFTHQRLQRTRLAQLPSVCVYNRPLHGSAAIASAPVCVCVRTALAHKSSFDLSITTSQPKERAAATLWLAPTTPTTLHL